MQRVVLSVDVGTSSSKGVLVSYDGTVLATATREHAVSRPRPGHVEMEAGIWWDEFVELSRELLESCPATVTAVGVSGMGPCVLLTDAENQPLRPAILYGVDTRAMAQVDRLTEKYGDEAIRERGGSSLTSQAAGAKVAWVADEEPALFARARRLFMPSSWLVHHLTGSYVLDHHSASQCTPLYDVDRHQWHAPWVDDICPALEMPPLLWSGEVAGEVHPEAAELTGIPQGTPVIAGTVDAWAEALSVGAHEVGDLMLMYGTTLFLVNTVSTKVTSPSLWGTVGALPNTHNLAGGMSTSGAITSWWRDLFGGVGFEELTRLADESGPGSNGLLMLPYFAGERTPILDPQARGTLVGLTVSHTRGDLYRATLEAIGFGIRHNIETMREAGGDVRRIVAVGGGTQGDLWTQIVTDATGLEQVIHTQTIGASYGGALLAAQTQADVSIEDWNPVRAIVRPQAEAAAVLDELYPHYRALYLATRDINHALASRQVR